MNILNITIKELTQNIRNFKGMMLMILFPMVLILILGTALSGMFDKTVQFKDVNVLYTNTGNGDLAVAFNKFVEMSGNDAQFSFTPADSIQHGMDAVKDTKYAAYVQVREDLGEIEIYKNERYGFKANLVEAVLNGFIQRYSVIPAVASVNPSIVAKIAGEGIHEYVRSVPVNDKREPNSMDYYAITMLTLILMYSSLTSIWSVKGEINDKTMNRLILSPVRKYEIFTGKILGCFVITLFQAMIVLLFSRFVLKTYWGDNILVVIALVTAEIIMAVSLGIAVGFAVKNTSAATSLLNMAIPLIVFLGGGYIPVDTFNGVLRAISECSPLRWINKAIFQVVFSSDYSSVITAITLNLAIAVVLITVSSIKFRKEAA